VIDNDPQGDLAIDQAGLPIHTVLFATIHAGPAGQSNGFEFELWAIFAGSVHEHSFGIVCLLSGMSAVTG